jgi:arylsulfatase A-like enzyme
MHTGARDPGKPVWGSWVHLALGSANENLPGYVVLADPAGLPDDGARNWSSGFLPPIHQGTAFNTEGPPLRYLQPPAGETATTRSRKEAFARWLNERHLEQFDGSAELAARMEQMALAGRMQLEATDAFDVEQESPATRELYGMKREITRSYGRRCLQARRLVERGVRFVQLFPQQRPWDSHSDNDETTRRCCEETDGPVAGLLTDLARRGLLESTLVIWGGEFGRLPISEGTIGRDHNPHAFSIWLAGAGIRGGVTHGVTDDFGYRAIEDRVSVPDLHATLLHLLGLDHERLTYRHQTLDHKLTGNEDARIIDSILA